MKKRSLSLIGIFTVLLLCAGFATCHNPVMERWWDERSQPASNPEDEPGGGGENFGIVVFDTDGGTPQPKAIKIAWGSVIGRLRPISRETDGFLGWFDEKGNPWDIETRPVTREDDVNGDGFITITVRWVPFTPPPPPPPPPTPPSPPPPPPPPPSIPVYIIGFVPYPGFETLPSNAVTIPNQHIAASAKVVQPVGPPVLPDGRGFTGWYTEEEYIHRWNFDIPPSTDVVLFARWEEVFRTVRFDANGGTRPDGFTELTHAFTVSLNHGLVQDPGPLVKTGYSFVGWYLLEDGYDYRWNFTTKRVTDSDVPQRDFTLSAKWAKNIYFVNFDITPSTAAAPERQSVIHGEKAVRPDNPAPPADTLVFAGWYMEDTFLNQWDFDSFEVNNSTTLFARWMPLTRIVIFTPNDGRDTEPIQFIIPIGNPLPNPRLSPNWQGFLSYQWYFDPGFRTGTFVNFTTYRVEVPNDVMGMDPLYIFARWMMPSHSITFNARDPDGLITSRPGNRDTVADPQTVRHGERLRRPVIATEQVIPGFYLDGWYTDTSWTRRWDFDNDVVTSANPLFARWMVANYTITFNLRNPPTGIPSHFIHPPDQHISHGRHAIEPFMPPLLADDANRYSFLRWDKSADGGITFQPFDFNDPVTSDLSLYARWVPPVPDMVWVPRGSFVMGDSSVSGSLAAYHAYPTRRVTLDGFYIGRYQVTQFDGYPLQQSNTGFAQIMAHLPRPNPSQFTGVATRPVENVSWFDAIAYSNTRSAQAGLAPVYTINGTNVTANFDNDGYRLPTEAEWEFAARGGDGSPNNYPYAGSDNPDTVAWFNGTVGREPVGFRTTQTVGRLRPNKLGIYDMSGNVSEWVWDWFASYRDIISTLPFDEAHINPRGPAFGTERVRRGGAWNNAMGNIRSVVRNSEAPSAAHWAVGFRVARGPSVIW